MNMGGQRFGHEGLPRQARRLGRYLKRFGAAAGARNFLRLQYGPPRVRLTVPAIDAEVLVRRGTSDEPTFDQIFLEGDYDFDFTGLDPRLIIDAGANVGYSTIFFARRFPRAHVVALEPEAGNFAMLRENTAGLANVTAMQCALWCRKCHLRIENPDDPSWSFMITEAAGPSPDAIEATTIPDILRAVNRSRVDLLKLDIEGSERELFSAGFEDWLPEIEALVVELHDWMRPGCARSFYRALADYDFNQYQRNENLLVRKSVRPAAAVSREETSEAGR
jgi:FkbM family methyltransferase